MAQQINLFDPALERQRAWLTLRNVTGLAVGLAVAVGALGYAERRELAPLATLSTANETRLKAAREQIAVLGQQMANRKPDPHLEQEVVAKRFLLATRGEVLALLRKSIGEEAAPPFADYLRGLARQTIPGLWLTAFSIEAQSGGMEIRGRTIDPALLPTYIRRLNGEPAFRGQAFAALKLDTGKPDAPHPAPSTGAAKAPVPVLAARYHEFSLIPLPANTVGGAG
jgi:MSHA biogenesis protein MshI